MMRIFALFVCLLSVSQGYGMREAERRTTLIQKFQTSFPLGEGNFCFLSNLSPPNNISIGQGTYYYGENPAKFFEKNVIYPYPDSGEQLIIGKFCQIAAEAKFIMNGGNHNLNGFSTYPFHAIGESWTGVPSLGVIKGHTVVGNDVWIGYDALIMPGVKIGDGAIIAARSHVTKNVPPYTIVGGNPAKEIRKKFDDYKIAYFLQGLKWWDFPLEQLTKPLVTALAEGNLEEVKKLCPSQKTLVAKEPWDLIGSAAYFSEYAPQALVVCDIDLTLWAPQGLSDFFPPQLTKLVDKAFQDFISSEVGKQYLPSYEKPEMGWGKWLHLQMTLYKMWLVGEHYIPFPEAQKMITMLRERGHEIVYVTGLGEGQSTTGHFENDLFCFLPKGERFQTQRLALLKAHGFLPEDIPSDEQVDLSAHVNTRTSGVSLPSGSVVYEQNVVMCNFLTASPFLPEGQACSLKPWALEAYLQHQENTVPSVMIAIDDYSQFVDSFCTWSPEKQEAPKIHGIHTTLLKPKTRENDLSMEDQKLLSNDENITKFLAYETSSLFLSIFFSNQELAPVSFEKFTGQVLEDAHSSLQNFKVVYAEILSRMIASSPS